MLDFQRYLGSSVFMHMHDKVVPTISQSDNQYLRASILIIIGIV